MYNFLSKYSDDSDGDDCMKSFSNPPPVGAGDFYLNPLSSTKPPMPIA